MLNWLLFLAVGVLAVYAADRAWLRHVERSGQRLHDPEGYLELTARMTELCHGDRAHVDRLIGEQKRLHPQATHADAVRLAMRQLLAPQEIHEKKSLKGR
ncbi:MULTISPECIES: hypothetical protein [unclassified Herbaspirillum]|uniref:hypothetical protein n=1 Tax=unclassified Herbaspirillum TaxID=2624150 RepID=UPI0011530DD4|nr:MULTISPECIES: hypothetical protein [unclassified Herbaspirillum]MBB5393189.1 hypothetical protein [Herbaspirillum sp. SJZ102]TQK04170.1 hypothetical protein FB599_2721 [Herbaspirillum sp. SJZ130]TQK10045.1 hypothetical protein FB598_3041 [Herbaspirillum sp. SJZ106]